MKARRLKSPPLETGSKQQMNNLNPRQARLAIDDFIAQHVAQIFRRVETQGMRKHANQLHRLLSIIHDGDVARIVQGLGEYADKIAAFELTTGARNGHHKRAAEEIRKLAGEIDRDSCPWRDLYHLLSTSPVQLNLARVLWRENRRYAEKWSVDLSTLTEEVWGDALTEDRTIRTNVSRLSKWLLEHGVAIAIEVKAAGETPEVECQLISVDETQIASFSNSDNEARKKVIQVKAAESKRAMARPELLLELIQNKAQPTK